MMNNSVPVINDTTREEQDFKRSNTLRGYLQYSACSGTCIKSFYDIFAPSILSCFGFPILLVGIVGIAYFTISFMEQFAIVVSIMVLIIIMSIVMITTGVGYLMLLKYETASKSSTQRFLMKYTPGFIVVLLAMVVIALGLTAAVIATRLPDVTQLCNNTTQQSEALQESTKNTDCVSRLESAFQNVLGAVAVISIAVGILQIFGEVFWCVSLRYEYHKMNGFMPFLTPVFLIGFTFLAIGIWALLRLSKLHNLLVTQPMIVIPVLLIMLGVLTGILLIGFLLGANFIKNTERLAPICLSMALLRILLSVLALIGISLGIAAVFQNTFINVLDDNTFSDYYNDQQVQDAWAATQKDFKCCGVNNFTDYQLVFGNTSVPISCCNTTSLSTCAEIVSNAQQANKTGSIFSRGCGSQLESFYHYTFTVVGGVAITVGVLQIIGLITRCIVLQYHSVKATGTGVCDRCKLTLASCICLT